MSGHHAVETRVSFAFVHHEEDRFLGVQLLRNEAFCAECRSDGTRFAQPQLTSFRLFQCIRQLIAGGVACAVALAFFIRIRMRLPAWRFLSLL